MEKAVELIETWAAKARGVPGARLEVVRLPGRTPLILIEVPGRGDAILMYGHLDKQPEMKGWIEGAARGSLSSRTKNSTAAAAPTTATRCTPAWPRSAR